PRRGAGVSADDRGGRAAAADAPARAVERQGAAAHRDHPRAAGLGGHHRGLGALDRAAAARPARAHRVLGVARRVRGRRLHPAHLPRGVMERALAAIVGASRRHAWVVTLLLLLLSIAGGLYTAGHISIDTDTNRLISP